MTPGSAAEVAAVLAACASAGVAVVPFGGGTSVVGGVEPLAGPHGSVIALDLRRLRHCAVDPHVADGTARARAAGARGGGRARRGGRHARPLPAVVRVRDDRRLRGHAVRRPGVSGLRPVRRAGDERRDARPGGTPRDARDAAHRRRARAPRADRRLRGHPGRDHRRHGPGQAGPGGQALRGLDRRRFRGRGRRGPRPRPRGPPARRDAALRRGGNPRLARPLRDDRRQARAPRPLPAAAEAYRRLHDDRRLGGGGGGRGAPPGAVGAHPPRPRGGPPRLGARPCLEPRPVRRPVPARRAARPRLLRRDAGDVAHVVELSGAVHGGRRRAAHGALRPGHAGPRLVPPVACLSRRRLALLHVRLPAPGGSRDRSLAGGEERPPARRSSPRAARSPITTQWDGTTPPTCRPRWGRRASKRCAR